MDYILSFSLVYKFGNNNRVQQLVSTLIGKNVFIEQQSKTGASNKEKIPNENVIKTAPRAKIIRTRSKSRCSFAQKDSQVNLKITQNSSIEDPRKPTIKDTTAISETPTTNESNISDTLNNNHSNKVENKAGDEKASQEKKKKSPNEKEKTTIKKKDKSDKCDKQCSSAITDSNEDNISIADRIVSKRKQKHSETENVKRPKGPEKVVKTKTKLTEEEK